MASQLNGKTPDSGPGLHETWAEAKQGGQPHSEKQWVKIGHSLPKFKLIIIEPIWLNAKLNLICNCFEAAHDMSDCVTCDHIIRILS